MLFASKPVVRHNAEWESFLQLRLSRCWSSTVCGDINDYFQEAIFNR